MSSKERYDNLVKSRDEHKVLLSRSTLTKHKVMIKNKLVKIREEIKEHVKEFNRSK